MPIETSTPTAGTTTIDPGAGAPNAGGTTPTAQRPAEEGAQGATGTPAGTGAPTPKPEQQLAVGEQQKQQTQEGEKKPDAQQGGEGEPSDAAPAPVEVEIPEGVVADKADVEAFVKLAGELGLDSTKAQKLVDFQAALNKRAAESVKTKAEEARKAQFAEWQKEIEADRELGGQKLAETKELCSKVLRKLGSDALVDFLEGSGLGQHPEMVRFFRNVGARMSEDTLGGTIRAPTPQDDAAALHRALYPSMFKDQE